VILVGKTRRSALGTEISALVQSVTCLSELVDPDAALFSMLVAPFIIWLLATPLTRCPYQERMPIFPLLEIRHDTIHDMRLRRKQVYSVDIAIRRPGLFNLFNIYNQSGCCAQA
jgi:hypothetical protein